MVKIIDGDGTGVVLEWSFEGKPKFRRTRGKKGIYKAYHGVIVRIPQDLIELISHDGVHTYIYEHFETVCLTPDEPPKEVKAHKARINRTGKLEPYNATTEVPGKLFDTGLMKEAVYRYYPDRKDYISGKYGLVTMDVRGDAPRKHLRKYIDGENAKITYETYVNESQAPYGINFHEDMIEILNPAKIYVYELDGTFYLTGIEPNIEHIATEEHNLINRLIHHHIIDEYTERIEFILSLREKDPLNKTLPKIELSPVQADTIRAK